LYALPDVPLTLTHDNQDADIQHNWEVYTSEDDFLSGEAPFAATEIEAGPVVQTLQFGPLEVGEYYYHCVVHPQMNGILYVQLPTADGGADQPAADSTPVPGEGAPAP
jgi:hypothetical protein